MYHLYEVLNTQNGHEYYYAHNLKRVWQLEHHLSHQADWYNTTPKAIPSDYQLWRAIMKPPEFLVIDHGIVCKEIADRLKEKDEEFESM